MASPRARAIADLIDPVVPNLASAPQEITGDPATYVQPATVNAQLFGNVPVVSTSNVDAVQAVQVVLNSPSQSGLGSNISGGGNTMAVASGFWKFTAILDAGDRTKTSSIAWRGTTNILDAVVAARRWAVVLADLLGNAGTGAPDTTPSAASPYITYLRITDARFPRFGSLLASPAGSVDYCGLSGATLNANSADFLATALSLRLFGVDATTGAQGFANHALYGIPDAVVVQGDQLNLNLLASGQPYSNWVAIYLNFLFSTGNAMGIMVQDPTELQKQVTAFVSAIVPPATELTWQLTVPAHGYASGDRVALTQVNNPFFRGRYKVNVVDVNTLTLVNGPPSSVRPVPTTGKVQRYQLASGIKKNVFAQITNTGLQLVAPFGLKVSKRNPARAFNPVSFRRKVRRPH